MSMFAARLVLVVLIGAVLPGCSGTIATGDSQACVQELRLANQELEDARSKGLAGRIPWIKAANLLATANARMQAEKIDECLEDARRARRYIREAEK